MKSSKSILPRKLLALALAFAVAATWMIPSSFAVYAADGTEPAQQEAEAEEASAATALPEAVDGTITLTGDVALAETAVIADSAVLDLAGYTISGPSGSYPTALSVTQGTLTVTDSSEGKAGKITVSGDYATAISGSVVLEAGTVSASGSMAYGINVPKSAAAVINGGEVYVSGAEAIAVNLPKGSSAELNGGKVTAEYSGQEGVYAVYAGGASAVFTQNGGEIAVTGPSSKAVQVMGSNAKAVVNDGSITVNGDNSAGISSSPFMPTQIEIKGGSIAVSGNRANAVYADEDATVSISGGTITSENSSAVSSYKNNKINVSGGSITSNAGAGIAFASTGNTLAVTGGSIAGTTYGVQISNPAKNTVTVTDEAINNISGESGAFNANLIKDSETGAYKAIAGAYVLMNIPYSDFYKAEVAGEVPGVDTVTSATVNKKRFYNLAEGSYHESADSVGIDGAVYPVYIEDFSAFKEAAANKGAKEVADSDELSFTVNVRGKQTQFDLKGKETMFEAPSYSYYVLTEEPANYKTLTIAEDGSFAFSAVAKPATEKEIASPEVKTTDRHVDIAFIMPGDDFSEAVVNAAVITTSEGKKYGLSQVVHIWRKTDLGFDFEGVYEDLSGKTITNVTYYTTAGVFSYPVNIAIPAKEVAAAEKTAANAANTANKAKQTADNAKAAADEAKANAEEAMKTPGAAAVEAAKAYEETVKTLAEAAAAAKDAADKALEAAKAAGEAGSAAYADGSENMNAAQDAVNAANQLVSDSAEMTDDAAAAVKKAEADKAAADKAAADKAAADKAAADKAAADKAAADKAAAELAAYNGVLDPNLPKVKIKAPKKAKKAFTAKWKKLSKKQKKLVKGIEVEYSLTGDFSDGNMFKTASKKKANVKIKKLQSKQIYYMRAHTYVIRDGVKYVSDWSTVRKVKVK